MTDVEKACELETVLRAMVMGMAAEPRNVALGMRLDGRHVVFEVRCPGPDGGRLIGKQGKMARSIRSILGACATQMGMTVDVNIVGASQMGEGSDGDQA